MMSREKRMYLMLSSGFLFGSLGRFLIVVVFYINIK